MTEQISKVINKMIIETDTDVIKWSYSDNDWNGQYYTYIKGETVALTHRFTNHYLELLVFDKGKIPANKEELKLLFQACNDQAKRMRVVPKDIEEWIDKVLSNKHITRSAIIETESRSGLYSFKNILKWLFKKG
jgi:hypothetical protein